MTNDPIGSWNNAVVTGSHIDGAVIQPFKGFAPNGETRRAGCYGKQFQTSDAAWAWLQEHGFTEQHFKRPSAFINLELSPRTRRYLKTKSEAERWAIIGKLVDRDEYLDKVQHASYFQEQRDRWMAYIETGIGR